MWEGNPQMGKTNDAIRTGTENPINNLRGSGLRQHFQAGEETTVCQPRPSMKPLNYGFKTNESPRMEHPILRYVQSQKPLIRIWLMAQWPEHPAVVMEFFLFWFMISFSGMLKKIRSAFSFFINVKCWRGWWTYSIYLGPVCCLVVLFWWKFLLKLLFCYLFIY